MADDLFNGFEGFDTGTDSDDFENMGNNNQPANDIWGSDTQQENNSWDDNSNSDGPSAEDIWGSPSQNQEEVLTDDMDTNITNNFWGNQPQQTQPTNQQPTQQNDAMWGQTSNQEWNNSSIAPQQNSWANGMQNENFTPENNDSIDISNALRQGASKLKGKHLMLLAAVGLILIALIVMGLQNMQVKPKQTQNQNQQQAQQQQNNNNQQTDNTSANTQQQQNTKNNTNAVTLIEIPTDTALDYNGDIFSANGVVTEKVKYLQGRQVVYCVKIQITVGSATQEVLYYCNNSSYNTVAKGDLLSITYQQVSDGYISVNSISK